jgi:hypothetical protein
VGSSDDWEGAGLDAAWTGGLVSAEASGAKPIAASKSNPFRDIGVTDNPECAVYLAEGVSNARTPITGQFHAILRGVPAI